jgi:hypothetical protein
MEIALSTTKAEYITLSMVLQELILLMHQIKEAREHGFDFPFGSSMCSLQSV